MTKAVFKGSCLCGAVTYRIEGDPIVAAHCHCTDCQKLTGTGHATGAIFRESGIAISGAPAEYRLTADSGNVVTRLFCSKCGSPLFGKNAGMPGFMTVAAGTLDDPGAITPQMVLFARNRAHWDVMDGSLPSFETQPDGKPGG